MSIRNFIILLFSILFVIVVVLWFYIDSVTSEGLPSIDQLENPEQNLATQVVSSDGELLDLFSFQRRIYAPIDSIPPDFLNALISVEDRKFYDHWGVHVTRVIKAAVKNVLAGGIREGASTITMQLARNLFLNQRTTLERKIQEAFIAMQIEQTYTKDEILELYANTVIFGRGAWGIQVAAEIYFGKTPMELTTAECAFLVGILKNPEYYNGIRDMDRAVNRRNLVLRLMFEQDYIGDSEYEEAKAEPINLVLKKVSVDKRFMLAPHFVEMIRQKMSKDELKGKNLYTDGYIIFTTLNSRIQKHVNLAVEEHLEGFQKTFDRARFWSRNRDLLNTVLKEAISNRADYIAANSNKKKEIEKKLMNSRDFIDSVKNAKSTIQCAAVVLDPFNGNILSMVGASPKFIKEDPHAKFSLNHATQIRRQPGSSFKPILYASALEQGMTPESIVSREPFEYTDPFTGEVWAPRGMGKNIEEDSVTLYRALISSINTASARLITEYTNPSRVVAMAYRMGISSPSLFAVPALSLGAGGEVMPLEMISTYGTFVNKGIHVKPFSVKNIVDKHGNTVYQARKTLEATDVFSEDIAQQMVYMMSAVVNHGTGRGARRYFTGVDAGGKTGTTNDYADAWFIGFTPEILVGVWLGFDDRRVTFTDEYGYASYAAAPLWGRIMNKIYADKSLPYKKKKFEYSVMDSASGKTIDAMIMQNIHNTNKLREEQRENEDSPMNSFPQLPNINGDSE